MQLAVAAFVDREGAGALPVGGAPVRPGRGRAQDAAVHLIGEEGLADGLAVVAHEHVGDVGKKAVGLLQHHAGMGPGETGQGPHELDGQTEADGDVAREILKQLFEIRGVAAIGEKLELFAGLHLEDAAGAVQVEEGALDVLRLRRAVAIDPVGDGLVLDREHLLHAEGKITADRFHRAGEIRIDLLHLHLEDVDVEDVEAALRAVVEPGEGAVFIDAARPANVPEGVRGVVPVGTLRGVAHALDGIANDAVGDPGTE